MCSSKTISTSSLYYTFCHSSQSHSQFFWNEPCLSIFQGSAGPPDSWGYPEARLWRSFHDKFHSVYAAKALMNRVKGVWSLLKDLLFNRQFFFDYLCIRYGKSNRRQNMPTVSGNDNNPHSSDKRHRNYEPLLEHFLYCLRPEQFFRLIL